MVIILAGLFAVGHAQDAWDKKSSHTPDSADLLPNSGRIVYNGRLLEPPYEITTDGSTILINGIDIYEKPEKQNPIVDTSLQTMVDVTNRMFVLFDTWYYEVGFDSAEIMAYNYAQNKPGVDSAYFDEDSTLIVKFQCQEWPETMLFSPPDIAPDTSPVNTESNTVLRYNLVNASIDSFARAYENVGYDSALLLMIPFFNCENIVDSAWIEKDIGFLIKFKAVFGPELIMYEPPKPNSITELEKNHNDSALVKEAIRLKKAVDNGNLVIIGNKGGQIYLKYAQKHIKEINRIILSDEYSKVEKLNLLKRIVKNEYHAENILLNWIKK